MGGGGFTMEPENPALDDYVRTLAPAREPRICLLPTAGGDSEDQIRRFHTAFSGKHGFAFPLLADTDKTVAGLYGTLGPIGFPRRSVFIIDADGVVRYAHRAIAGLTYRPVKELVAELDKLTP